MPSDKPSLPRHIEDTVAAISEVHAEHRLHANRGQKMVGAVTGIAGTPAFIGALTVLVLGWIVTNLALSAAGRAAPDPPPFQALSCVASLAALYLAAMILGTQKHEDQMANHRDQLTLELAILSDQKSAKIIRLLEELRLNDPDQGDHADAEAEAMAVPADPKAVLDKIRSMQPGARQEG
jgi:uncharacterized membrane protein